MKKTIILIFGIVLLCSLVLAIPIDYQRVNVNGTDYYITDFTETDFIGNTIQLSEYGLQYSIILDNISLFKENVIFGQGSIEQLNKRINNIEYANCLNMGICTPIIEEPEPIIIDADIIYAQEYYTKSKTPEPTINYMQYFKIDLLSTKATHYASTPDHKYLSMEKRIQYLEGAVAQLSVELCTVGGNKYTWCGK